MAKLAEAALAAAFIMAGQMLWADVTPDAVWLSWQTLALAQGQQLTADSTETDGDTLSIRGIKLSLGTDGSVRLDEMSLIDNGDGTVAIVVPGSFPVHLVKPRDLPGAEQAKVELSVEVPGAEITASGTPDAINYDKHLPFLKITGTGQNEGGPTAVTLKATEVTGQYMAAAGAAGTTLTGAFAAKSLGLLAVSSGDAASNADIKLSLADLDGKVELADLPADSSLDLDAALNAGLTFDAQIHYGIGALDVSGMVEGLPVTLLGTLGGGAATLSLDATTFHYDLTNKALSLNVAGTDTGLGGDYTFVGAMADLSSSLDIHGRGWTNTDDFDAALKSGLVMAASASLGSTNIDFAGGPKDGSVQDAPVKVKASLAGANTDFTIAASQITYDLGSKAVSVSVTSPDIPLPNVSVEVGEVAVGVMLPLYKSDKPAPFSWLTKVIDLKLPEALWAMVDPAGSLSHDPATVIIDTKGTATVTTDLAQDATALESGSVETPGFLNTLDIPQVMARALGAEITAKGAFTFDPSDMVTLPDMPFPTGKLDIRATGLNGLVDKLVAMGFLDKEQAMQGKMGMSMFARNDMAKDEITTVLEFKDKHFFANGAQMQ